MASERSVATGGLERQILYSCNWGLKVVHFIGGASHALNNSDYWPIRLFGGGKKAL